jgi:ribonuclease P protein component
MFPRDHRLRQEKDILKTQRSRFNSKNAYFKSTISLSKYTNNRFCVVIGKKVLKKSNQRHRIKRRILAIIRTESDFFEKVMKPLDILIFCNNKLALKLNPQDLKSEIMSVIKKTIQQTTEFKSSFYTKNYRSRISSSVEQ